MCKKRAKTEVERRELKEWPASGQGGASNLGPKDSCEWIGKMKTWLTRKEPQRTPCETQKPKDAKRKGGLQSLRERVAIRFIRAWKAAPACA